MRRRCTKNDRDGVVVGHERLCVKERVAKAQGVKKAVATKVVRQCDGKTKGPPQETAAWVKRDARPK